MEVRNLIKETKKILTEPQYKFLKQLAYWSLSRKDYGIKLNGKTWIYNTHQQWAEQIGFGVTTVRESIAILERLGFISSDFLNPNKRRRVKYYSINFEAIENYFAQIAHKRVSQKIQKENIIKIAPVSTVSESSEQQLNRQMERQMYTYNKIQDDKSNKSINSKIFEEKIEDRTEIIDENPKPTVVQDMIRIWNQEFPNQKIISGSTEQVGVIHLTKQLARFLVASFKLKFENCLEKWKRYLRLIKTSAYMMGEKFKLSIQWVIKFLTIDRIRAGELGVDESKIPVDTDEIEKKAQAHVEAVDESETCKQYRREIIRKLSPAVYLSWFTKVDLIEESKDLIIRAANNFVRDYIKANFLEKLSKESLIFCKNLRKN